GLVDDGLNLVADADVLRHGRRPLRRTRRVLRHIAIRNMDEERELSGRDRAWKNPMRRPAPSGQRPTQWEREAQTDRRFEEVVHVATRVASGEECGQRDRYIDADGRNTAGLPPGGNRYDGCHRGNRVEPQEQAEHLDGAAGSEWV